MNAKLKLMNSILTWACFLSKALVDAKTWSSGEGCLHLHFINLSNGVEKLLNSCSREESLTQAYSGAL